MKFSAKNLVLLALMLASAVMASVLRPTASLADERPPISLKTMVPLFFGDWRELPNMSAQIVDPQQKELLEQIYSETLSRTYVNSSGYRIMLSIAYGKNQSDALQLHKPEVCYPAQGFVLEKNDAGSLATAFGDIPVRRLFTSSGPRKEPVTYWFTVGDTAIQGKLQRRLAELRYGLTGRIPDGMLFRVSSIDPDPVQAYRFQDLFVDQLLAAVSLDERKRLSGLGGPP